MLIRDLVYGEFKIELVLEELINTEAIQRLKHIHQGGASYLVNPKWNVTRYEHSVGTMLFVRLMGGSIEEQIAGLLHDISHTAFSHVVDFALDNKEEDYHEKVFEKVIEESEVPTVLKEYGYDYKDIIEDESKWTILEKPAPALCGDRIDYTLRDVLSYGVVSSEEVKEFIDNLKVVNGEVMITSIESAEWFVDIYYKEVIGFFMNPLNVYAYDRLAKAIKIALDINEVIFTDLLKTDEEVFNILKSSKSEEVITLINELNYKVKVVETEEDYDIYQLNKLRTIDPSIFINNSIYRASEKSNKVLSMNKEAVEKFKNGVYVKII